ncbi:Hypothetical predicted protein, partial [Paramuricea clavata]
NHYPAGPHAQLHDDPHAQLDDVEPIDQDQQLEDERDDHDTQRDDAERDDAGSDEVHTICDPEATQKEYALQTSQASSCDLSQELDIKPSQPKLQKCPINTNFPSKKTRSFNASWLSKCCKAFCFACKNVGSRSSADTTFTVTGFRKCTNALDKDKGFIKHQKSEVHKVCYEKWKAKLRISDGQDTSILEKLVPDQAKTIQNNREYFKLLFQYVIWFATNEIAFWGHDEAADSKNPGN